MHEDRFNVINLVLTGLSYEKITGKLSVCKSSIKVQVLSLYSVSHARNLFFFFFLESKHLRWGVREREWGDVIFRNSCINF